MPSIRWIHISAIYSNTVHLSIPQCLSQFCLSSLGGFSSPAWHSTNTADSSVSKCMNCCNVLRNVLGNVLDRVTDSMSDLRCTTPLCYFSLWFSRMILFRIAGYSYPKCGRSNRNCKTIESSEFTIHIASLLKVFKVAQQHAWSSWFWSLWFSVTGRLQTVKFLAFPEPFHHARRKL